MIGDAAVAALLAGTEPPAGVTPELGPLVQVLAELRGQPAGDELAREAETLAMFRRQFAAAAAARRPPAPKRRLLSRALAPRAAAAAAVVLSLAGAATAAYAGALPAAVQRLAHDVIGAPAPGTGPSARPPGPPPGRPGYGLCTAWALAREHGARRLQAAAFGKLTMAAGGPGQVTAYCAATGHSARPVPTPHRPGKPSGLPTPDRPGKPSGLPTPHPPGKPSGLPTPHRPGKPSGLPTPHGPGAPPSARPAPHPARQGGRAVA
jgi:hypothetical protein